MAGSFIMKSTVRGRHIYKESWLSNTGEELRVQCESDNVFDEFGVAVLKDKHYCGAHSYHAREISKICWYFLHMYSVAGNGLINCALYIYLHGKTAHVEKMMSLFY